jgi:hypothetical protein
MTLSAHCFGDGDGDRAVATGEGRPGHNTHWPLVVVEQGFTSPSSGRGYGEIPPAGSAFTSIQHSGGHPQYNSIGIGSLNSNSSLNRVAMNESC